MSHPRRSFLQQLSLGGLALGGLPVSLAAAESGMPLSARVQAESAELLARREAADDLVFDVTWADRLTGKYRAVFDVPKADSGSGVWRAGLWVDHYIKAFQAAPADVQPVIVIRHEGIALMMQQEFWARYDASKDTEVRDPVTDKKTRRNPVLANPESDPLPPLLARLTLDQQISRGAIVLGCNAAFRGLVSLVEKKDKATPEAARATALGLMLPGVILQPNGIFGVTLAQHHGCAYVMAS